MTQTLAMAGWGEDVLAALRLRAGMSQQDLAAALERSVRWVQNHEAKGKFLDVPRMHVKELKRLAEVLHVDVAQLYATSLPPSGFPPELEHKTREIENRPAATHAAPPLPDIPVYKATRAGQVSEKAGELKPVAFVPRGLFPWDAQAYCVEVEGDSMVPWISPGDYAMVSPGVGFQLGFPDGAECLVMDKTNVGEWTDCLKRVFRWGDDQLRLESHNINHKPRIVRRSDVALIPVVLRICRDYRRDGWDVAAIQNLKPGQNPAPVNGAAFEAQPFPDYDGPSASSQHPSE